LLLQPLADIHFNAAHTDGYSRKASLPTLYALMGIAAFILQFLTETISTDCRKWP